MLRERREEATKTVKGVTRPASRGDGQRWKGGDIAEFRGGGSSRSPLKQP